MAEWIPVAPDAVLLGQDQPVDALLLLADGKVSVELNGVAVDTLTEGRFLGGNAFLSPDETFTAPVTVKTTTPCRLAVWKLGQLRSQLGKDAALQTAVEASIGLEMSRFLKTARAHFLRAGL